MKNFTDKFYSLLSFLKHLNEHFYFRDTFVGVGR